MVVTAIALVAWGSTASATSFDAADEFSATSNPTGVWSYGWTASLGSAFNLYLINDTVGSGLSRWGVSNAGDVKVLSNQTGSVQALGGSDDWQPGELGLHPGADGRLSVIRFTAPSTDLYDIDAVFYGLDSHPVTTDVHVLLNSVSLFDANLNSYRGAGQPFSTTLSLSSGNTIDFVVGWGSNNDLNFDSTGLTATISQVPEPNTMLLAAFGVATLAAYRRRRPHSAITRS